MSGSRRSVFLAGLAALCLLLATLQAGPLTSPAVRSARDAAVASLGVYVALRSINAALSFAQEIEVGGSFGLSANAQPLKFLEPIDDTVERVAGAIFAISLLAGVLTVSIAPVSGLGFLLLAAGLMIGALRGLLVARAGAVAEPVCRAGNACNVTGVFLALVLPVSLSLGSVLGGHLTANQWTEAQSNLTQISDHARDLLGATEAAGLADTGGTALPSDASPGVLGRVWGEVSGAAAQTDAYIDAAGYFVVHADELLESSLIIVAIFLLRTLVLPVTFMLVMLVLTRRLARF